jgi:hypothetical protein
MSDEVDDCEKELDLHGYTRNSFAVTAVQVTEQNIEVVAKWCGSVLREAVPETGVAKHIHVDVRRPMTIRQSRAYVGDWLLKAGKGFKVYTDQAFQSCFTIDS